MSSKKSPSEPAEAPGRRYGITGGIGSGKSHICQFIEKAGYPIFYCDDEAKRIIRTSPGVRQALTALVGPGVYSPSGTLEKSVLAAYLCRSPRHAARVDAIVHPEVAKAFVEWAGRQRAGKIFMECALLFESGFDRLVDHTVLISAPEEQRIRRVMQRDGVSREKALEWINLQMPEAEKARRADTVIRNDYTPSFLPQLERLLED